MEFYSKKVTALLKLSSVIALSLCLGACSSDDSETLINSNKVGIETDFDGYETVSVSNGERIILEDTVTYHLCFGENQNFVVDEENDHLSRGILLTGYDSMNAPDKYTKYLISGLEKWGINPTTIYIGKLIQYYKKLPVSKGYSIFPSNSKYSSENRMGFNPPSMDIVGFHTLAPAEWNGYETAVTQLLYINCDASGIYWNKNVPCNPDDFIWYYRQIENE